MAKLTKAARRRAALKGWRSRSKRRNPGQRKPTKMAWFVNFHGAHQGTVYASSEKAAKAQARKKFGKGPYTLVRDNPGRSGRVKGYKVKGGRSVTLHNFTGSVIRKSNGQVLIRGKAKKR